MIGDRAFLNEPRRRDEEQAGCLFHEARDWKIRADKEFTNYAKIAIQMLFLPITNSQLPITNSQFPITNAQLPIPNSQFPIPNSQFPQK